MTEHRKLETGPSTAESKAVTGELYVLIRGGIICHETEVCPHQKTEDEAWTAFLNVFAEYREAHPGRLIFWRNTPELQRSHKGWVVRARLLISGDESEPSMYVCPNCKARTPHPDYCPECQWLRCDPTDVDER